MGAPETLAGFVNFASANYPAEHYGMILWNHGGGVNGGVCFDENNNSDSLELPELASGFSSTNIYKTAHKKFDWLSCDACLMSNFEIAMALSPYGNYYVASEEVEQGGWDYNFLPWLSNLTTEEMKSTEEICVKIAEMYVDMKKIDPSIYNMEQDMNVLNLTESTKTAKAVQELGKELIVYAQKEDNLDTWLEKVEGARNDTAGFGEDKEGSLAYDLTDFKAFLENMKSQIAVDDPDEAVLDNLDTVISLLDESTEDSFVTFHKSTEFVQDKNLNGVSVYFPYHAAYDTKYGTYNVVPSWTVFVEKFSKAYGEKGTEDVNLLEAFDHAANSYKYDSSINAIVVNVKPEKWNLFMSNIKSINVGKVRQAITEEGNKIDAFSTLVYCPLYRINEAKKQVIFYIKDFDMESNTKALLNGMPVAVMEEEDGGRNYVDCYIKTRETIQGEEAEEEDIDTFVAFANSIEYVMPRLNRIYRDSDERWKVEADSLWGIKLSLSAATEEGLPFLDKEHITSTTIKNDGFFLQFINKKDTAFNLPLCFADEEEYYDIENEIINQYQEQPATLSLFSVSQNSISQNSVSENNLEEESVTDTVSGNTLKQESTPKQENASERNPKPDATTKEEIEKTEKIEEIEKIIETVSGNAA